MNDIYIELRDLAIKNNVRFSETSSARGSIRESTLLKNRQEFNHEFRVILNKTQVTLELIKLNNENVEELKRDLVGTASTAREREINAKLQSIASENLRHTTKIKECMKEMEEDLQKSQEDMPDEPETHAKIVQIRAIQNEIKSVLNETQNVHSDYKQAAQAKIKRQVYLLDPNLTEEDQKRILADPKGMEKLVMKEMLGQASVQLQYAFDDIKEKHEGIKRLEASCLQVFQMLNDISQLVLAQGEMINDIETHLLKAQDYVKKTNKVLEETKAVGQTNRKKLCCIIFIGLATIGLILAPFIIKSINSS